MNNSGMCFEYGADARIRTGDLILTKDVLYRLSYISLKIGQRDYHTRRKGKNQYYLAILCEIRTRFTVPGLA